MKKQMLLTAVIVLLTLLLVDRGVARLFGPWNSPEWVGKSQAFHAAHPQGDVDYLFVGDSTVSLGFDPDLVAWSTFNLGRVALGPMELTELTRQLDRLDAHPRNICISISPYSYYATRWELNMDPLVLRRAAYGLTHFYKEPDIIGALSLPGRVRMREPVKEILTSVAEGSGPSFDIKKSGANITRTDVPQKWSQAIQDFEIPSTVQDAQYRNWVLDEIRTFKQEWNRRGTRVLWVFWPMHPDAFEWLRAQQGVPYSQYYQAEMQNLFGKDYLDFRTAMGRDQFLDAVHLRPNGAQMFAKMLREKLVTEAVTTTVTQPSLN